MLVSRARTENGGVHPAHSQSDTWRAAVHPSYQPGQHRPAALERRGFFPCFNNICDCMHPLALNSICLGQVNHSTSCHAKHEVRECDNINGNFFMGSTEKAIILKTKTKTKTKTEAKTRTKNKNKNKTKTKIKISDHFMSFEWTHLKVWLQFIID